MNLSFDVSSSILPKNDFEKAYDVVIVGAGPAGLTAAVYSKRKGLTTLVVGEKIGGQVMDTTSVENYTGFDYITGENLAHAFKDHVKSLKVPIKEFAKVTTILSEDSKHVLTLDDGSTVEAKAVIIATGSKPRKLGVPGEDEFYGRGVTYCAICDGPLFEGKDVIVAGGGNSAIEAAIDLAKIAKTVTVIHRSKLRADQIVIDQLAKYDNVKVMLETQIESVYGERMLGGVNVIDKATGQKTQVAANGMFVEIGYLPNSDWLKGIVTLNTHGEVIVDGHGATDKPGIFAAGDITQVPFKQVVIAAGEGARAALSANDYINRL
ncbi:MULTISPECIES: FAD-dependent oxidoreductase [unclassified Fusibacter]|uniref:FAD-dependent oxidoreductase n=1 Tax=unclassified Fusibacter TaxID=2624464 RepID=UPI0010111180|nr:MULTISPECIES: FAD-dependent oxidoreductase [unclassified Fusibacter]MCK8059373.1 FAD-dependent oxidoreductase [Fusibacter sp. A2]NPE21163.1 FAD-dependent oxidoreductase [Fusibacter sp. A1]RXV62431.1 FAD-dependent oxidoreductase [Fusibacter sp. A1]